MGNCFPGGGAHGGDAADAAAGMLFPVGRIILEEESTPLNIFSLAEIQAMSGLTLHDLEGRVLSASTRAIHKGKNSTTTYDVRPTFRQCVHVP